MKQNFSLFLEFKQPVSPFLSEEGNYGQKQKEFERCREEFLQSAKQFFNKYYKQLTKVLGEPFRAFLISYMPLYTNFQESVSPLNSQNSKLRLKRNYRIFLFLYGNCISARKGQDFYVKNEICNIMTDWQLISHTELTKATKIERLKRVQTVRGGLNLLYDYLFARNYQERFEEELSRMTEGTLEEGSSSNNPKTRVSTPTSIRDEISLNLQIHAIYGNAESLIKFHNDCKQNKTASTRSLWELEKGIKALSVNDKKYQYPIVPDSVNSMIFPSLVIFQRVELPDQIMAVQDPSSSNTNQINHFQYAQNRKMAPLIEEKC